jgi:uncharacterized protein (DUF2062 family)
MPRKLFRRFMPSHESIRDNRTIARLGPWIQHPNLWHLNRRSVSGGVAAGLFAGLIPGSNPIQFTIAALLAIAGKVNLPVAILTTLYTNPFTVVPLYYLAFKIGMLVLGESGDVVTSVPLGMENKSFGEWVSELFHWLATVGKPLAVGLPLLALLLGVVGYFVMDWTWRLYVRCSWQNRRKRRAARP